MENIIFDRSKLKGKIKEVFGTQKKFAKRLEMSEPKVSARLNNDTELSNKEIKVWAEELGISLEEIPVYFFDT